MNLGKNKRTLIEVGLFERLSAYQHYVIDNYYNIYIELNIETHSIRPFNITTETKILHLHDNWRIY